MKIAMVTVGYNLPGATKLLMESALTECSHDITFLVFSHSQLSDKVAELRELGQRDDVVLKDYGENRGLAKSWNEGILDGFNDSFDVVMCANEDLTFSPGDVDTLAAAALENPESYLITGRCFHYPDQAWSSSEYGGFAINPIAIDVLGCFDENVFPVYYEDADYNRRAALARLSKHFCPETNMYHGGSQSLSQPEVAQQNQITWTKNREYYNEKWGGDPNEEKFLFPFDDRRFTYYVDPRVRDAPYHGFNRNDHDIVKI